MARKEQWITSQEAARLLTHNSGHEVSDAYVRWLGSKNKLTSKALDKRTKLYLKSDVEHYYVKQRGRKEEPVAKEEGQGQERAQEEHVA